jgi:hypothetical protein
MAASRLGLFLVVVALAAAGVAVGIWFAVSRDDAADRAPSGSVQLVLESPDDFYGKRIAVQGSVSGSFTDNTFTLGDPQPGPDDLLVVRYGKPVQVEQNEVVNVIGVVRKFDAGIRAKLKTSVQDAPLLDPFAGKPVLVAIEIAKIR